MSYADRADPLPKADAEKFRAFVHTFATAEIAPRAAAIDRANDFPADLWPKLGAAGLLGITVPQKYGGQELGYTAHLIAMEELSRASASVALSYAAHSNLCIDNLYRHGTEEQRIRYLPKLCSGTWIGALAMSEPEAGSDAIGSMHCQAEAHGEDWIANGTKKWITNGPEADVLIVYMRTAANDSDPRAITAFIIDAGIKGFRKGPRTDKLGMRGSNTCELIFENCAIAGTQILGPIHQGRQILTSGLDSERLILSGGPLGIMQAAIDIVLPFVRERKQFGQAIGSFELMQAKLADIYTRLQAARAFALEVARQFDNGLRSRKNAASCLLFAAESAVWVALEAIQSLGARGYMNDSPVSRLLRDAKLYDIGGGTNEMRRIIIGRELFEDRT
jgi:isovaleryl-CoA dehydrogenase